MNINWISNIPVQTTIKLGEMNAKLLEKVEELTLYQIDLLQKLNQQNEEIVKMKKTINQLLSSNRN